MRVQRIPSMSAASGAAAAVAFALLTVVPEASSQVFDAEPDWVGSGNGRNVFGGVVRAAGDVDGDGYGDVIVCEQGYDGTFFDEGRVLVYHGGPTGLSDTPAWIVTGGVEGRWLGQEAGSAGDVDGDGFDDVLISTSNADDGVPDIYLYMGSPTGLVSTPAVWGSADPAWDRSWVDSFAYAGDVNGDGFSDVLVTSVDGPGVVPVVLMFFGSAGGLSTSPSWEFFPEDYGIEVASAGDVNADGYDDVLISVRLYSELPIYYMGRVHLFLGSASGPSSVSDWQITGEVENQELGWSIGSAGDVNVDGYADVLIGNRRAGGEALLYRGGPSGLEPSPAWSRYVEPLEYYSIQIGPLGDANGDGFSDFFVSASPLYWETEPGYIEVFLGGSIPGSDPDHVVVAPADDAGCYGEAVSAAGDVNGDGFSDLVARACLEPLHLDVVHAYHGGKSSLLCTTGPFQELAPPPGGGSTQYGHAVASLGDVDADGHGDLAIGAYGYTQLISEQGMVEVYRGSDAGAELHWVRYGDQADAAFGWAVAGAGDVDGDGYEELLIGAPQATENDYANAGRVDLHLGSASGIEDPVAWSVAGDAINELTGYAVAGGGDLNGDGYADVVVGKPGYSGTQPYEGAIEVYLGSSAGLATTPDVLRHSSVPLSVMGISVNIAGDVDGDGYDDVVFGASGFTFTLDGQGLAGLYRGTPDGLEADASWLVVGAQEDAAMGRRVIGAGDVNADGYADLLVAAPLHVGLFGTKGRVELYFGGPDGPNATPDQVLEEVWGEFGTSLAALGDLDRDGYDDVAIGAPYHGENPLGGDDDDRGRVLVFRGGPGGLSYGWELLGDTENELLGTDLAGPLDIDGDGFEDLAIGAEGYDHPTLDTGHVLIVRGQCGAITPFASARRFVDGVRIPPGGSAGSDAVRLELFGHGAMGRAEIRLEWEMTDRAGNVRTGEGPWTDSGDPVAARATAAGVPLEGIVTGLDPDTEYGWRVRVGTRSPYFRHGPWFSNPGSSLSEMDLRSGDVILDVETGSPPAQRYLAAPSPNPTSSMTTIRFDLSAPAEIELEVFGVGGRRIRTLEVRHRGEGRHTVTWDGRDDRGHPVSAGVYFIRLAAGNEVMTRRVTVIR